MKANRNYESILKSFVSDCGSEDNESQALLLYRASQIIRGELKLVKGINISSPTNDDISLEPAAEIVPDKLYIFLHWISEGDKGNNLISFARENTDNEELKTEKFCLQHKISFTFRLMEKKILQNMLAWLSRYVILQDQNLQYSY